MPKSYDTRKSLVALDQDSTLIAVIEMSQASWLVAGIVPGLERQPLKKLDPDAKAVIRLLERWRAEGVKAGRRITRLAVAFESGRDGFWLARHLQGHGIEAHVIHAASVAVARTPFETPPAAAPQGRRAGPRPTDSTPTCSSAPSSAGCAASPITAPWRRSRRWPPKTPGGRAASARS